MSNAGTVPQTINPAASPVQPTQPGPGHIPPSNVPPTGNASLYVGDLDEEVTEAMIFEKFSSVGQILSIRVCRDMISRKSLGYAYVNFAQAADAERAIDTLNFDTLKDRQMRIMWSQRDPSLRKSGVGNLFIKNLEKGVTTRELYDTFSLFGEILSCKITTDDKGNSKGYGFIHFSNKESADKAIEKLNEKVINGKKIYVANFLPRVQRGGNDSSEPAYNNLFIKNFGDDMTDEKLRKMFEPFGEITSVKVELNAESKSKGFGFVCYREPKQALAAVTAMNGQDYNGKTLFVGRAMKKSERVDLLRSQYEKKKAEKTTKYAVGVNLYVKNLEDTIDDDTLKKEFESFGTITSVRVMRDQGGRSKGFGFVCFNYAEEATKAVTEMNGKLVLGKPLYVALAQRKEERRVHLANQYMQRQFAIRSSINTGGAPMMHLPPNAMNPAFMNYQPAAPFFAQGMPAARQMFAGQPPAAPMFSQRPQPRWNAPQPGVRPAMPMQQPLYQNAMMRQMNMGQGQRMPTMQVQPPQQVMPNMPGVPKAPAAVRAQHQPNNVQFTGNVRNLQPVNTNQVPRPMMQLQPGMEPTGVAPTQNGTGGYSKTNNPTEFMRLIQNQNASDQKQMLGEKVYEYIHNWGHADIAGKLTGMLLEMDTRELLAMVVSAMNNEQENTLREQVVKAKEVLLKTPKPSAPSMDEAQPTEKPN